MADTGYTLPVFAVAAAKAAVLHLASRPRSPHQVELHLLPGTADIPIEQVAQIDDQTALAICRSDPGDNLDLTRHTPVWAWVQWGDRQGDALHLEAGEGLGRTAAGEAAIYRYAHQLFETNLLPWIPSDRSLTVRILLPEGIQLAQRTSNAAFGILDGLALLGTSGIAQPLSVADHLDTLREGIQDKAETQPHLVFCIGNNGLQVAQRLGIPATVQVQTGNWLGAMLVEAGMREVQSVLLLGYHGKLVKLAAGIFNTSSHVADGRLESLAAILAQVPGEGDRLTQIRAVLAASTADAAQRYLTEQGLAAMVFPQLADRISKRAIAYTQKYSDRTLTVGTLLFDRQGTLLGQDAAATQLLHRLTALV
jgi:cobalt-precorrin-5B (C1)-methyltransferase